MATLTDIRRAAERVVVSQTLPALPQGTFVVMTRVASRAMTYLLHGAKDDPQAEVIGRIEAKGDDVAVYIGGELCGGSVAPAGSERGAFAQMVQAHHARSSSSKTPQRDV